MIFCCLLDETVFWRPLLGSYLIQFEAPEDGPEQCHSFSGFLPSCLPTSCLAGCMGFKIRATCSGVSRMTGVL